MGELMDLKDGSLDKGKLIEAAETDRKMLTSQIQDLRQRISEQEELLKESKDVQQSLHTKVGICILKTRRILRLSRSSPQLMRRQR